MTDSTTTPSIIYRDYAPGDAETVKHLVDEAFAISRWVKAPRLLDNAKEVYLRTVLAASTWAQVAEMNGQVVGVIMGRIHGRPRLPGRWRHHLVSAWSMLKLAVIGINEHRSLLQFFASNRVYAQLKKSVTVPTTDELTLFAVSAETRGTGIGTSLYQRFLAHLREHGRDDFYLFTDTRCSYGFYEKQGMTRAGSREMTILLDGEPEPLVVLLYAGTARATA